MNLSSVFYLSNIYTNSSLFDCPRCPYFVVRRADFCDPEFLAEAIELVLPWNVDNAEDKRPEFSSRDRDILNRLSDHQLPLLPPLSTELDDGAPKSKKETSERRFLYLGLVDLLLAYAYDRCDREEDENPESACLIVKMAASLSWLMVGA